MERTGGLEDTWQTLTQESKQMKIHKTPAGAYKIGDHQYQLTHVVLEDDNGRYDMGNIALEHLSVFLHPRNRIINNFDADARKAWLAEQQIS